MKKLLLFLSISFLVSCSSDDAEPVQESSQTFLEKFNGSGFVDSQGEDYVYFYNSTGIFMKFAEIDPVEGNFCASLKIGSQALDGDAIIVDILQNNSTTLIVEIDYKNSVDDKQVITYTILANGNISIEDNDGDSNTIGLPTNITYSSLCN